jgi:hypothetical protein
LRSFFVASLLASACATPPGALPPDAGQGSLVRPDAADVDLDAAEPPARDGAPAADARPAFVFQRLSDPDRTVVTDSDGAWVATFTDHTHTVTLTGPERTFDEATAVAVTHDVQVRMLPDPFGGEVDETWLAAALAAAKDPDDPDLLALAMQYLAGAPSLFDGTLQIAGDASYGPLDPVTGARIEGSDFNDYLGVTWFHPDGIDDPETSQLGCLDCSGYVRMLCGYRLGLPMIKGSDGGGTSIPRRAVQMLASGPGVVTIPDTGEQIVVFDRLAVGDLVFFDADSGDGTDVDHVGIYLGVDAVGHLRFLSSRKSPDGPTFGDTNGSSRLDGTGLFARSFRAARRL